MVRIDVIKTDGFIKSVEMTGHANFDEHGQDIVCAGASAVVFGATNSIFELTEIKPKLDIDNTGGYFYLEILNRDDNVNLILQTMVISLKTIEQSYEGYIKVINK